MFLRAYLTQLQRAIAEGVPVDGYSHWSAQDNFEWIDGFGTRFGLIYVDVDTQQRIPKLSAEWFREAARHNAWCSHDHRWNWQASNLRPSDYESVPGRPSDGA
jgi:beta-glucosidase/6-phospho-beta-glucosidase/beta-galactosidase